MTDPRENRFYEATLKRVLWGDPREDVMHRLTINEVPADEAEAVYAAAVRERLKTIRGDCWGTFRTGLVLALSAVTIIFCCFTAFSTRDGQFFMMPRIIYGGGGAAFLYGGWKMLDGLSGVLMAARKEGPV